MDRFFTRMGRAAPYAGLLVAATATIGSLFMSQVLGWLPCEMCWYQRIAMYPILLLLLIGIITADSRVYRYVLPLAVIGGFVSTYHILYQKTDLFPASPCELNSGISCKGDYLNAFNGMITIPTLALIAFGLIVVSAVIARMATDPMLIDDETDDGDETADAKGVPAPVARPSAGLRVAGALLAIALAFGLVYTVGGSLRAAQAPKTPTPLGTPSGSPFATPVSSAANGARLFSEYCTMCHGASGDGITNLAPTLAGSTLVKTGSEDDLLRMIRKGRLPTDADNKSGLLMPQSGGMAAYGDDDLRSVIRYLKTIIR
ncbi:MAG: disulfide bond formation protein B [Thermoflexales bacterium]|nr:disulfide bond formation protein B [Thermoflexales bacterium]